MTSITHAGARILFIAAALLVSGCAIQPPITATYGTGDRSFVLAAGGLHDLAAALAEEFTRSTSTTVQLAMVESEQSLDLLKAGRVDAVLVHAPAAEEKAVKEGWAVERTLIAAQRFLILGPPDDPAQIRDAFCSLDAFRRIHRRQATFLSPGEQSKTRKKEIETWERARLRPWGNWYITDNGSMLAALTRADEMGGYVMTGSADWRVGSKKMEQLSVLFQESDDLIDPYHLLVAPPGQTAGRDTAAEFAAFAASEQGQRIVRDFGKERLGAARYLDAASARRYLR
jgi:tungstate transport system substrate-binding protein